MGRLFCRRFVALAVAYAVALNLVVPLLAAFALAAEAAPASVAELCASEQPGTIPGAGDRNGHAPVCPLGSACSTQDCGANGPFAAGSTGAATFAFDPRPLLPSIRLEGKALRPREFGAQFARAPPHA
jgi:hypothetical protein